MKLLHVITGLGSGGAEAVMSRVIAGATDDEHVVVSLTGGDVYADVLQARHVPVHVLDMRRGRISPSAMKRLRAIVRETKPDVVQTWMYHADLLGGIAARRAGARNVVWGVHHSSLAADTSLSTRLVARACAALSRVVPRRIICCSVPARDVHAGIGYARDKMVVISNGVDLDAFAPDPAAGGRIRRELGIPAAARVCGMVARWHPLKDHPTLLAALAPLRESPVDWRAILAGPGMTTANAELMAHVRRHRLEDRVLCVGPRGDVPGIMNALDLHVLSSAGEAFGNVTVEAMACGTPAVVTDVGAGAFVVGSTGWVVPARNPGLLQAAIAGAFAQMADATDWERRRDAARGRAVAEFGADRMVREYQRVWRGAAGC